MHRPLLTGMPGRELKKKGTEISHKSGWIMVYSCYASLVYSMLGVTTHKHGESRFIYRHNQWSKETWQINSTKDGGCCVAMKNISANMKMVDDPPK